MTVKARRSVLLFAELISHRPQAHGCEVKLLREPLRDRRPWNADGRTSESTEGDAWSRLPARGVLPWPTQGQRAVDERERDAALGIDVSRLSLGANPSCAR